VHFIHSQCGHFTTKNGASLRVGVGAVVADTTAPATQKQRAPRQQGCRATRCRRMMRRRNVLLAALCSLIGALAWNKKQPSSQGSVSAVRPASLPEESGLGLYSVVPWTDDCRGDACRQSSLGNHRISLKVRGRLGEGTFAWAHVVWRLPGLGFSANLWSQLLRMRSPSGDTIKLHVLSVNDETISFLFEPLSCDDSQPDEVVVGQPASERAEETCSYFLYYLPYIPTCETGPSRACPTPYKRNTIDKRCAGHYGQQLGERACCGQPGTLDSPGYTCPAHAPTCTGYIEASAWGQCVDERPEAQAPQSAWGRKALEHTRTSGWQERTPTARVVGMHARTERDAFHPMEVAATAAEVAEVRAWGRPLLVWPEERTRPIRLMHALPLVWYAACHLNAL